MTATTPDVSRKLGEGKQQGHRTRGFRWPDSDMCPSWDVSPPNYRSFFSSSPLLAQNISTSVNFVAKTGVKQCSQTKSVESINVSFPGVRFSLYQHQYTSPSDVISNRLRNIACDWPKLLESTITPLWALIVINGKGRFLLKI